MRKKTKSAKGVISQPATHGHPDLPREPTAPRFGCESARRQATAAPRRVPRGQHIRSGRHIGEARDERRKNRIPRTLEIIPVRRSHVGTGGKSQRVQRPTAQVRSQIWARPTTARRYARVHKTGFGNRQRSEQKETQKCEHDFQLKNYYGLYVQQRIKTCLG